MLMPKIIVLTSIYHTWLTTLVFWFGFIESIILAVIGLILFISLFNN